ncbi:MAG: GWxTD domain-containing protein [Acidobacteriota bacterium]
MRKRPLLLLCLSLALQAAASAGPPKQAGQSKKQIKRLQQEEAEDYYRKWLGEDAVYIVTEEERKVFLDLSSAAEKDAFIEQFWFRRDPDPRSGVNGFKTEHYRRIHYANETFHAGMPGWKTDRGRIYIMFGPPDRKESYPAGGWYQRKYHEGGGSTSVFPFEIWEYRYIKGVGSEIELEFVDTSASNLYRLTTDAQEKDEFLRVPGMGLTHEEMFNPAFGGAKSRERVVGIRDQGFLPGIYERAKDSPFAKAELMMKISKAPSIRFTDLKESVAASVSYDQLPFQVSSHFIRIDEGKLLVSVTAAFDNRDVAFKQQEDGAWKSLLQIYGLVRNLNRRIVHEWDDDIQALYPDEELQGALLLKGVYQKKMALAPGRYKLDLIIKDLESGRIGTKATSINVPSAPSQGLSTSSVVLARSIEGTDQDISQPFVLANFKIKPQLDGVFHAGGYLGFYLEIYNFAVDQSSGLPGVEIKYAIVPRGALAESFKTVRRGISMFSDRLYIARMVHLIDLEKGRYQLVLTISDSLSGQSTTTRTPFVIR